MKLALVLSREKRGLARETPATRKAKARADLTSIVFEKKSEEGLTALIEVILYVYILNPSEEAAHAIAV